MKLEIYIISKIVKRERERGEGVRKRDRHNYTKTDSRRNAEGQREKQIVREATYR